MAPRVSARAACTSAGIRTRGSVLYCQPLGTPPGGRGTGRRSGSAGYRAARNAMLKAFPATVAVAATIVSRVGRIHRTVDTPLTRAPLPAVGWQAGDQR